MIETVGVLKERKKVATDTYSITLKLKEDLKPLPGQFVLLDFLEEPVGFRAYSVAGYKGNEMEIVFRVVGTFTKKAMECDLGTLFKVRGPFGKMVLEKAKRIVFIAGGVGISPFLYMISWIKEKNLDCDVALIYSEKKEEYIVKREFLEELKKDRRFRVIITLTREEKPGFLHGRINKDLLKEFKDYDLFYIVGRVGMVEAMRRYLRELGVPEARIRSEGWG